LNYAFAGEFSEFEIMEADSEEQIINMTLYYMPEFKMKFKSIFTVNKFLELFKGSEN